MKRLIPYCFSLFPASAPIRGVYLVNLSVFLGFLVRNFKLPITL